MATGAERLSMASAPNSSDRPRRPQRQSSAAAPTTQASTSRAPPPPPPPSSSSYHSETSDSESEQAVTRKYLKKSQERQDRGIRKEFANVHTRIDSLAQSLQEFKSETLTFQESMEQFKSETLAFQAKSVIFQARQNNKGAPTLFSSIEIVPKFDEKLQRTVVPSEPPKSIPEFLALREETNTQRLLDLLIFYGVIPYSESAPPDNDYDRRRVLETFVREDRVEAWSALGYALGLDVDHITTYAEMERARRSKRPAGSRSEHSHIIKRPRQAEDPARPSPRATAGSHPSPEHASRISPTSEPAHVLEDAHAAPIPRPSPSDDGHAERTRTMISLRRKSPTEVSSESAVEGTVSTTQS